MGSPINEISEIHVKQFADSLSHEFAQTDSVLAPYCIQQSINSEKFSYDVIGQLGINEKSSIFSDNNLERAGYERRWGNSQTLIKAIGIDADEDILKTKISPQSDIITEIVSGANRLKDEKIIEAALGDVQGGKEGLASDTPRLIRGSSLHTIAHGGTSITLAKLIAIRERFAQQEIPESTKKIVVLSAKQESALFGISQYNSFDFNHTKPLATGVISEFMGLTLVRSEKLTKTGSNRNCIAFAAGSLMLATGRSRKTDISVRKDKQGFPLQIYFEENYGALRISEQGVIKVECTES